MRLDNMEHERPGDRGVEGVAAALEHGTAGGLATQCVDVVGAEPAAQGGRVVWAGGGTKPVGLVDTVIS